MRVAHAAARADAGEPAEALALLAALDAEDVASYQPYWVTRATALVAVGDTQAAGDALQRAIALTGDAAVRAFLAESLRA